ncbi:hypothetical protein ANN_23428 [Periplaneta americana]|uniref:Uncharacterized protein n=1 Tax=Periplaneta americana TaxID=6978 RepID=A0ABQ8SMI7_PERAM|nr:hypothetical protein ANN_23428 [Periplaneta americana]
MSPGSSTDSYPEFAHIGLRENPGKNLNQKRAKTAQLLQRKEQKQEGNSGCDVGKRTVPVRKYDSILKALSSLENAFGIRNWMKQAEDREGWKRIINEVKALLGCSSNEEEEESICVVVVITEDVQNVHLLFEYRPHTDVSLTCEHDPKLQEYCVYPQNMPQFDSEGIPSQAQETNKTNDFK